MEGPNAPGRFIMWYRNEMAILALWHRPHLAGIYSHYQGVQPIPVVPLRQEESPAANSRRRRRPSRGHLRRTRSRQDL
ncbi:uncharacterized protein [Palaemon carinicauda]|uniref:uncharacterized protein isoform X4 n=1 Tax=Palaemon carinicauda TaxID=392227 RepID=UPI0035B5DDCF